ncbi:MAG: tail fiber domain-containing protein, partial [Salinivirgaceae bacterium]|nr:tail fiber domain-containing protein [Salinivirgaceae bacterium]
MKKIFMAIAAVAIASASYAQGIEVTETQNVLSGKSYFNGNIGIGDNPNTDYNLYVKGKSYYNGNVGIGVFPSTTPQYDPTNTTTQTSYKLRVRGNCEFKGSVDIDGDITISKNHTLKIGDKTIDQFITDKLGSNQGATATPSASAGSTNDDVNCKTIKTSCKVTIGNPSSTTNMLNVGGDCIVYGVIRTPGTVNAGNVSANSVSTSSVSAQTVSAQYLKYAVSCTKSSDKRFKKNIKNLPTEVVSKLKQIESKTYQYKSQDELLTLYQSVNGDTAQVKYFNTNRDQYGFLAQ